MLFDSNVLIRYINGEPDIVEQLNTWRQEGRAFIISSVTTAEVLSLKILSAGAIVKVKLFLETFVSVPFDDAIADVAAGLRRNYGLGLPDAAIAATAVILELPLVTQDQQFKKVKEITVIEI
jgi:hypothetical protein